MDHEIVIWLMGVGSGMLVGISLARLYFHTQIRQKYVPLARYQEAEKDVQELIRIGKKIAADYMDYVIWSREKLTPPPLPTNEPSGFKN